MFVSNCNQYVGYPYFIMHKLMKTSWMNIIGYDDNIVGINMKAHKNSKGDIGMS